jgi:hypothetical protein
MLRTIMIAAGAALIAGPAMAQPAAPDHVTHVRTVADLAAVCDPHVVGVARLESIAYCQGFLTSAGQYHALLHPTGGRARPSFCMPSPGPSVAEGGIGFARWARENPTHAQEPALDGLLRWQQTSFPCPNPTNARGARHAR